MATDYATLAARARMLADRLTAAGYGAGQRVATVSGNSADQVVAFFACALLGIAFVPLSWRLTPAELGALIERTGPALLLIDEEPMHGETGPHWILAHAVAGQAVVLEDPWINVDTAETWVDTHMMPVSPADLDRLVRWGADGYRGVIFVAGR